LRTVPVTILIHWLARDLPAAFVNQESHVGINKDQVEGRAKEVGGKVQEELGKLTGNKTQQAKGLVNQVAGKGQAKVGDLAEKVNDLNKKP
jgi:uncharacterized protein YjbJ (UPF0337 family)